MHFQWMSEWSPVRNCNHNPIGPKVSLIAFQATACTTFVCCCITTLNVFLSLQWRVVIVRSSSAAWVAFRMIFTLRVCMCAFHGSNIQLFMISARVPAKFHHPPDRKICKWSIFRCVCYHVPIHWIYRSCISNWASTTMKKCCLPFATRCSRALLPSSTPLSWLHNVNRSVESANQKPYRNGRPLEHFFQYKICAAALAHNVRGGRERDRVTERTQGSQAYTKLSIYLASLFTHSLEAHTNLSSCSFTRSLKVWYLLGFLIHSCS